MLSWRSCDSSIDDHDTREVDAVTRRHVVTTLAAVAVLFAGGTTGFHYLLDEPWHSAFYRTVVTATLTGLDTTPSGVGAELLTIAVVLAGVAIFGYFVSQLFHEVVRNLESGALRERRRRKMIDQLHDHFIICGYGRVGRRAAGELAASGTPFVVLDFSEDALTAAEEHGVLFQNGNGAEDADLEAAGIDRAAGILASADSDAQNLYITLSARQRRPDLTIVARASDAEAERKLRLAGADRVVQPYSSAGVEMAKLALKPQVAAFLEIVSSHGGPELRFEELEVKDDCAQAGSTIRELAIRRSTGALVVALRKADGTFDITPNPDARLDPGDVLIAMGTEPELQALEDMLAPRERVGA
jgi:voltage-gated potassium channel